MVGESRRIHLLVEGQTEETVVRQLIEPYLRTRDRWVTVSVLKTSRPAGRGWHSGGVTSWRQIYGDVRRLLADTSIDVLTTLIDYYALPIDVPGMATRPAGAPWARVEHVEAMMAETFDDSRFLPHLTLHEIEAWVFAAGEHLAELFGDHHAKAVLDEMRSAGGPEEIDDGPATAPSKRLQRLIPTYVKTVDGPLVLDQFGLDGVRASCPHADAWLRRLGV